MNESRAAALRPFLAWLLRVDDVELWYWRGEQDVLGWDSSDR